MSVNKVYAMPRMREFLERNGPWSQLVINVARDGERVEL
jgi:hypothetical protein